MAKAIALLLSIFATLVTRAHSEGSSEPNAIKATRVPKAPRLDGILDDEAWALASPISNFTQRDPNEGQPPTERTEVRIVYDDRALYVGVSCFMQEPGHMIANEMSRDFQSFAEDNFMVIIDTYHDLRNGFLFVTNPNGARYDALVTDEGNGVNSDWNGVWDVRTSITDQGWFAEIEIPFSTLRFTDAVEQIWGVNFERLIRSKREQILWQGFLLNYGIEKVSQAGLLVGIRNVSRGTDLELKPYGLAGIQRDYAPSGESRSTLTKVGLDLKYPVTPTLTLDVTTNTDFAQVESDRAQINLTRFPLYFPEKRDFFLEGSGIFSFNFGASPRPFYSRRIGIAGEDQIPIIVGGRLVGKAGPYDIGVLNMQTAVKGPEHTTNYSVVRVKRDVLDHSYIGILATNKQLTGSHNRLLGADFDVRLSNLFGNNNLEIGGGIAGTQSSGLSGQAMAYRFFVDYPNDVIDHFIGIRSVQSNFNPEMGFVSRFGKQISWALSLTPRPHILGIRTLEFIPVGVEYYLDVNNIPESAYWEWRPLGIHMDSGEDFEFNILRTFDRLSGDFDIYEGITIPQGRYYFTRYEVQAATSASRLLSGDIYYGWGDYYTGTRAAFSFEAILKAGPHVSISGDYSRNDIRLADGAFVTHEVGSRFRYAFSTMLDASFFGQWNNEDQAININFRLHWIPEIGSDLFFVVNQEFDTAGRVQLSRTTVVAKVAYLFVE
jgi:hypothetical protein